ncbi:unnamed protein product [Lampetra planeri]
METHRASLETLLSDFVETALRPVGEMERCNRVAGVSQVPSTRPAISKCGPIAPHGSHVASNGTPRSISTLAEATETHATGLYKGQQQKDDKRQVFFL